MKRITMQKRRLGRTGLQVSVIGLGGARFINLRPEEGERVVRRAFDLGINYFDTARAYGDSEEKVGSALRNVRDQCIIATKVYGAAEWAEKGAEKLLKQSFHNLKTDRIDLVQLHAVDTEDALKKAIGGGGALQALKRARSQGRIDFIGITGHRPYILAKAIRTGEFDTVLVPLNFVTREAAEELMPLAKSLDVGVVIMKPFLLHFDQRTNIASGPDEFRSLLGEDGPTRSKTALRYVLAHDIATVVPGAASVEEVEAMVKVGESFKGLDEEEKDRFKVGELPAEPFCRDCGLCMPCPEFINIPYILRLYALFASYGVKEYARRRYQRLSKQKRDYSEDRNPSQIRDFMVPRKILRLAGVSLAS